jgi:hypothetical protein
MTLMGS